MPFTASAYQAFARDFSVAFGATDAITRQTMVRVAEGEKARVIADATARSGGLPPLYRQVVNGSENTDLSAVTADGTIVFGWNYTREIVRDTVTALVMRSPIVTGQYIESIEVMADGTAVGRGRDGTHNLDGITLSTKVVTVVVTAAYARRLEVGRRAPKDRRGRNTGSPFVLQVKPHIVEETTTVARRLWGNLAEFEYNYVNITDPYVLKAGSDSIRVKARREISEMAYPAIVITPRIP
jgi:hypothetical protein